MKDFKQWLEVNVPPTALPNTGSPVSNTMLQLPADQQLQQQTMISKVMQNDLAMLTNTMKNVKNPILKNKFGQWLTQIYKTQTI